MVLLLSKVPGEVGSSPSITTCDPTPVPLWLGLFAVPVLPSACHTCPFHCDVCCMVPVCHGVSLECSILVLGGFMGLSQRDRLCSCPCMTPGTGHHAASRGATNTNISLSCCTAPSPLGSAQHQADPKLQMNPGVIIISKSHYHNDRKEVAAHGTKPARCSQFLYCSSDSITEPMAKHFSSFRVVPLPLHVTTHLWPPTCVNSFICWHTPIHPMKRAKGKAGLRD